MEASGSLSWIAFTDTGVRHRWGIAPVSYSIPMLLLSNNMNHIFWHWHRWSTFFCFQANCTVNMNHIYRHQHRSSMLLFLIQFLKTDHESYLQTCTDNETFSLKSLGVVYCKSLLFVTEGCWKINQAAVMRQAKQSGIKNNKLTNNFSIATCW